MEKQITYPLVPLLPQETTVPCIQAQAYTTCHWTMPSAVIPDHQPHSIPLHLLYWRRQRHSTTAQPLSLKAFQVSKTEGHNRAMFLRLVSSVSWYFAYTITQTNDRWTFGAARWGHCTVRKRRAPKTQWRGAISKKGKDLKFTAAKAWNLACIQECFYFSITQAIIDTSGRASRQNVQFPELLGFELCSQWAAPKAILLCSHLGGGGRREFWRNCEIIG